MEALLASKMIQLGFAGFCVVLFGFVVWLVNQILKILTETNRIIARNTAVIEKVDIRSRQELKLMRALHNRLLERPCLLEKKEAV